MMNKLRKFCVVCYGITYEGKLCERCKEERRINDSKRLNYREGVFRKEEKV